MSQKLIQLLEEMTPQERAEVEAFAAFIIVRRIYSSLNSLPTISLCRN